MISELFCLFTGIIAVSCGERLNFDDRVDQFSRILMTPSLVLIWSFTDPIHPLILLEAPDDIYSFKFNPSDPNIIAGGCINGQVLALTHFIRGMEEGY